MISPRPCSCSLSWTSRSGRSLLVSQVRRHRGDRACPGVLAQADVLRVGSQPDARRGEDPVALPERGDVLACPVDVPGALPPEHGLSWPADAERQPNRHPDPGAKSNLRSSQSAALAVVARIRTSTSSSFGTGFNTSLSSRTSVVRSSCTLLLSWVSGSCVRSGPNPSVQHRAAELPGATLRLLAFQRSGSCRTPHRRAIRFEPADPRSCPRTLGVNNYGCLVLRSGSFTFPFVLLGSDGLAPSGRCSGPSGRPTRPGRRRHHHHRRRQLEALQETRRQGHRRALRVRADRGGGRTHGIETSPRSIGRLLTVACPGRSSSHARERLTRESRVGGD